MAHTLPVRPGAELRLLFQRTDPVDVRGGDIDWARFFELAERANSFPVIWRRLSRLPKGSVPEAIAERMQRRSMVAAFSLLTQGKLLERALETLASVGIEAVLLKGAGLAASVYGSFTNRPMGDLDVLVRPKDALRARDALAANGWTWRHDPALDAFYENHAHLAPMFDTSRLGASIEIHVDLFLKGHPFAFGAESIWRDRRRVRVGGQDSWMPSARHQLLHAVIHFAWSHGMASGAWTTFRDVDALASRGEIEWDDFVGLAEAAGAASCAYWTLAIARGLRAAEVPDGVLDRLAPRMTPVARALAMRHVLAGLVGPEGRCPSLRVQRALWELAIRPERSGHGQARPWMRDEQYTPSLEKGVMDEDVLSWRRYVRALVRPR